MAPSRSSCERRSDLPTARKLHTLTAGGLVPAIYFYIYGLSLQLTAPSPGGEAAQSGKGRAPSLGDVFVLRVGSVRTAAAAAPAFLPTGGTRERAGASRG